MADSQEQKRILVVGENEQERIELCRILEEIGQQADPAASHEEALKLIEGKSFNLILMDLKMSGMDSQAALQAIRDQDPLRSQRVLALTATLFPDMLTRVRASGFDGFLAKPLQRSELEKAVRQLQKTSLEPSRQEGVDSEPVKTDSAEEPLSQTARAKLSVALESGDLRAVSKVAEELKRETGSRPLGQKISPVGSSVLACGHAAENGFVELTIELERQQLMLPLPGNSLVSRIEQITNRPAMGHEHPTFFSKVFEVLGQMVERTLQTGRCDCVCSQWSRPHEPIRRADMGKGVGIEKETNLEASLEDA